MKITRRTALLGVAGGMIGGLPVCQSSLWSTWQPLDLHGQHNGDPILVFMDGNGNFTTHYPDGRIEIEHYKWLDMPANSDSG
jgi:hypothetical protein